MESLLRLAADPSAWAALVTLMIMEIVLGVDNLVFVSLVSNQVVPERRTAVRRIGISLALVLRLALLSTIAFIVSLTKPVFTLPWKLPPGTGLPPVDFAFSWRDIILIAGGLFLIWKATREIHERMHPADYSKPASAARQAGLNFTSAIIQILILDMIFSIDSILTAVGMTHELAIMMIAVVLAVALMILAVDPLANFINRNPTAVMLALGFLLMIGVTLIADGFGVEIPKGYIYAAMAFAGGVETLNAIVRGRNRPKPPPDREQGPADVP